MSARSRSIALFLFAFLFLVNPALGRVCSIALSSASEDRGATFGRIGFVHVERPDIMGVAQVSEVYSPQPRLPVKPGDEVNVRVAGEDPEGDPVTLSTSGLPPASGRAEDADIRCGR